MTDPVKPPLTALISSPAKTTFPIHHHPLLIHPSKYKTTVTPPAPPTSNYLYPSDHDSPTNLTPKVTAICTPVCIPTGIRAPHTPRPGSIPHPAHGPRHSHAPHQYVRGAVRVV